MEFSSKGNVVDENYEQSNALVITIAFSSALSRKFGFFQEPDQRSMFSPYQHIIFNMFSPYQQIRFLPRASTFKSQ